MTGLLRKHSREDSGSLLGREGWEAMERENKSITGINDELMQFHFHF
jgi:hypothetical protein